MENLGLKVGKYYQGEKVSNFIFNGLFEKEELIIDKNKNLVTIAQGVDFIKQQFYNFNLFTGDETKLIKTKSIEINLIGSYQIFPKNEKYKYYKQLLIKNHLWKN